MADVPGQSDKNAPRPGVGQLLGPKSVKFVSTAPQWPPIPAFNKGQTPTLLETAEAQKVAAFIANSLFHSSGRLLTGSPHRNRFELTQTPRGNDFQLWIQTDLIFDLAPHLGGELNVNGFPIASYGKHLILKPHGNNSVLISGGEGWPGTLLLGGPPSAGGNQSFIGIQCPSNPDETIYKWPGADGTSGHVLSTNGSGTMSWVAPGGGGGGGYTWEVTASSGTFQTVSSGDQVDWIQGNGILTSVAAVGGSDASVTVEADDTYYWFWLEGDGGTVPRKKIMCNGTDAETLSIIAKDAGSGIVTDTNTDNTLAIDTDLTFLRKINMVGANYTGPATLDIDHRELNITLSDHLSGIGAAGTLTDGPDLLIAVIRDPYFIDETRIASQDTGIVGGDTTLVPWENNSNSNRSKLVAGDGIRLNGYDGATAPYVGDPHITIETTFDKSAIVAGREPGQYVGVQCVEMPEVRFEDVVKILVGEEGMIDHPIDPQFVFICEPNSIEAVGHVCSDPAVAGIKIIDGHTLRVKFSHVTPLPESITIKLSGIRKGRADRRFPEYSEKEAESNNAFWQLWRQGATV